MEIFEELGGCAVIAVVAVVILVLVICVAVVVVGVSLPDIVGLAG